MKKFKDIRTYFMGVPVRCDEYNEQLKPTITMEKAEKIVEKIRAAFWEYKRVVGKPPEVINATAEAVWAFQMVCGLERKEGRKMDDNAHKTIDDWIKILKRFKKSAGGDAEVRFIGLIDGKECDDMFLHGTGYSIESEIYVMLADYQRRNISR